MSVLQRQLASLRATRSNELDLRAQKLAHSKSLLFDSSTAAAQSFDTIYQLCYEGFEDLRALDSRFSQYARTLFSPQSQYQERQNMTGKENEELDRIVNSFLGLVGSRLLLKPAQKAVEWLVRRFKIHEHNVDQLVFTFLPYHTTPLFLAVLALLPTTLSSSLRFLHQYVNTLQNPPRDALVHAIVHVPSFFSSFNQYVLTVSRGRNQHASLLALWATVMVQGVDGILSTGISGRLHLRRQRNDDLLARLFPILNEALTLKGAPELVLGCYMVTIVLVGKADVSETALTALMCAVANSWNEGSVNAGIACLALIAEQRGSRTLPRAALKAILMVQDLPNILKSLSTHQPVEALTLGLVEALLLPNEPDHPKDPVPFIKRLLQHDLISESNEQIFLTSLRDRLDSFTTSAHHSSSPIKDRRQLIDLMEWQAATSNLTSAWPLQNEQIPHDSNNDMSLAQTASTEVHSSDAAARLTEELRCIHLPGGVGILKSTSQESLGRLLKLFEAAALDSNFLSMQIHEEVAHIGAKASPSSLDLYTYVWCCSASVSARQAALEMATRALANYVVSTASCQTSILLALVAMQDQSKKVRSACASFMSVLARRLEVVPGRGFTTVDSATGVSEHLSISDDTISTKDLSLFMNIMVGTGLEECIADADVVRSRLRQALGNHSTSGSDAPRTTKLKSSQKATIFAAFCQQIGQLESRTMRMKIVRLLNTLERVAGQPRSKYLLPVFKQYLSRLSYEEVELSCEGLDVEDYDRELLAITHAGDTDAISLLASLAADETRSSRGSLHRAALGRLQTLWPSVSPANQKSLISSLLPKLAWTEHMNDTISNQRPLVLRALPLKMDVLLSLIDDVLSGIRSFREASSKRRRTQASPSVALQVTLCDQIAVDQLTIVVELADALTSEPSVQQLHSLFEVLGESQMLSILTGSELSYIVNTTLNALWSTMRALGDIEANIKLDTSIVRADLLVDCVRTTSSPQARNAALLLLAALSEQIPHEVLHSVMPVFTMISSTTVKQNDDFSAHVVDETIRKVIPMLAQKLKEEEQDLIVSTAEILMNFATAFEHIPPHRRSQLFVLLASSLGPKQSLFALISTLVDQYPSNQDVKEFCSTLFVQFDSIASLETVYQYLNMVNDSQMSVQSLLRTLSKQDYNALQRDSITVEHLRMISILLDTRPFKERLRKDLRVPSLAGPLRVSFGKSFEAILRISQRANVPIQSATSQAMERLLAVFPFDALVAALSPLLDQGSDILCKAALRTVEKRIKMIKQAGGHTRDALVHLMRRLTSTLADENNGSVHACALVCIDCICEKFGKVNPNAVSEAMQVVASDRCLLSPNLILRSLSLHCLASAVEVVGHDFTPLLLSAQKATLTSMREAVRGEDQDERLYSAAMAFFTALGEHVPFVISRSTLVAIFECSSVSISAGLGSEGREYWSHFAQVAASRMETVLLVRALSDVWFISMGNGLQATQEQITLAKAMVEYQPKAVIARNAPFISALFLEMFDLRRCLQKSAQFLTTDVDRLEQALNEVLVIFVLKINDATFRPIFGQLLDWCRILITHDLEGWQSRVTTLFNLTCALSDELKSIFTSYFGSLANIASEILSDVSSTNDRSQALRNSVVRCLSSSFRHDRSDFWQVPARFDAISKPLVSHLSLVSIAAAQGSVIPAVVELATAAASSDNHKSLNGLILMLFRSDKSRTRLAAIKCQQSLALELGDDWLINLPEMLPFMSELQEDDDEGVERETHIWINTIEEILGESLSSMLQ